MFQKIIDYFQAWLWDSNFLVSFLSWIQDSFWESNMILTEAGLIFCLWIYFLFTYFKRKYNFKKEEGLNTEEFIEEHWIKIILFTVLWSLIIFSFYLFWFWIDLLSIFMKLSEPDIDWLYNWFYVFSLCWKSTMLLSIWYLVIISSFLITVFNWIIYFVINEWSEVSKGEWESNNLWWFKNMWVACLVFITIFSTNWVDKTAWFIVNWFEKSWICAKIEWETD